MLYHHLLTSLAAGTVPAEKVFERYRLRPEEPFSDTFLAQIANLDPASPFSSSDPLPQGGSQGSGISPKTTQLPRADRDGERADSLSELLNHNTLVSLWSLLISEARLTFPPRPEGSTQGPTISELLTVEFRTALPPPSPPPPPPPPKTSRTTSTSTPATVGAKADPTLLGRRLFHLNNPNLDAYLASEIAWWRGERPTRGVEVEEAFKCRICEFAEGCEWRQERVEEWLRKAKLRAEYGRGGGRSEI